MPACHSLLRSLHRQTLLSPPHPVCDSSKQAILRVVPLLYALYTTSDSKAKLNMYSEVVVDRKLSQLT